MIKIGLCTSELDNQCSILCLVFLMWCFSGLPKKRNPRNRRNPRIATPHLLPRNPLPKKRNTLNQNIILQLILFYVYFVAYILAILSTWCSMLYFS